MSLIDNSIILTFLPPQADTEDYVEISGEFMRGMADFEINIPLSCNPYVPRSKRGKEWREGWLLAEHEYIRAVEDFNAKD